MNSISKQLFLKLSPLLLLFVAIYLHNYFHIHPEECPNGSFRLYSKDICHQWLSCDDLQDMTPIGLLTRGVVKKIYLYKYNGHYLVVSKLSDSRYSEDFFQTHRILRQLSPNLFLVQLIGWCNEDNLMTEYHPFGDATRLPSILSHLSQTNNISLRLELCLNYIQVIDFLHNSPIGTLVMCDSNTLEKTLSQFLISNHLRLVLNDLDALPQVVSEGVKCGRRQLFGSFVAPEQLWNSQEPFNDSAIKPYDHKTDIWKIPDVCHWFLTEGLSEEYIPRVEQLEEQLKEIMIDCKTISPNDRPSARRVMARFEEVFHHFTTLTDNGLIDY